MMHPRAAALLSAVCSYLAAHGYPPTLRELGRATGITSTSVVSYHLRALEAAGYLVRDKGQARAIRMVER